jgi:hypothetical protein
MQDSYGEANLAIIGNALINEPVVLCIWSYVNGLKEEPHTNLIQ